MAMFNFTIEIADVQVEYCHRKVNSGLWPGLSIQLAVGSIQLAVGSPQSSVFSWQSAVLFSPDHFSLFTFHFSLLKKVLHNRAYFSTMKHLSYQIGLFLRNSQYTRHAFNHTGN